MVNRRRPESGIGFVFRVAWTFFFALLIITGMSLGYYLAPVIFRAGNFVFGFYGAMVISKVFYDFYRSRRNAEKIDLRRERALEAMRRGKYQPKVGVQQVGRAEPPRVHYWAFKRFQEMVDRASTGETYAMTKYLYVTDGNTVNNPRVGNVNSSDPILRFLAQAFQKAPNGEPPTAAPARVRFGTWLWNLVLRGFFFIVDILFQILIMPPRLVHYLVLLPIERTINWLFPGTVPPQGFLPLPTDIPPEWRLPRPGRGDVSFIAEIALRVFGIENTEVIWLDYVVSEIRTLEELKKVNDLYNLVKNSPKRNFIIFQPARSKREAIYTASRTLIRAGMEKIMFTDSDTVLQPEALLELVLASYPLHRFERKIGVVTGDVKIFNVDNWLALMSSLRYWFAFNLERASQSNGGYVTCVSGPLGLYDADDLSQILLDWLNHEFFGRPCTFGEDRDLTNRILKLGHSVLYTPRAICWTDTPTLVRIWLRQQTRWNKSYYREFIENMFSLYKHGPYLSVDLWYQITFPIFLSISLGNLISAGIRTGDWSYAVLWASTIMIGGFLRAFFAIWVEWNSPLDPQGRSKWKYLLFFGYGYLYVGFLIWVRNFALATLLDTGWGTPTDRTGKQVGTSTLSS